MPLETLGQSASALLDQAASTVKGLRSSLYKKRLEEQELRRKAQLVTTLKQTQSDAASYEEWLDASQRLDVLLGNEQWKLEDHDSAVYDSTVVEFRLHQLRQARLRGDMDALMNLIRTSLSRNLGNMGDPRLYVNSFTGSKRLIEDYITEVETALDTLLSCGPGTISPKSLLAKLINTRRAFGRTALVLSGGSTFGILHIGVMRELHRARLLPQVISGSSAGSIFASLVCIHVEDEIEDLLKLPAQKDGFEIFEPIDHPEGAMVRLARFLKHGTWFDNKYLSNTMRELLGDLTFLEAYNRTRRILNVTVSPSSIHEMPKLLNYLTAPNVLIWSAVCASCSVPLVFPSYDILAKNAKTGEFYSWNPATFIDGSVDNDLPLARLAEMFNVNHFIACQVNPHVVPFVKVAETISLLDPENTQYKQRSLRSMLHNSQLALSNEVAHILELASEMGLFKNVNTKLGSVLQQQYSGDITILPDIHLKELPHLFRNPDKKFFASAELRAARATWPKLSLIHNRCAIELALVKAIHKLRARMVAQNFDVSASMVMDAATFDPMESDLPLLRRHSSTKLHHRRQRSDGMAAKYLIRRHSIQHFPSQTSSPLARSRKAQSVHFSGFSLSSGGSPRSKRYAHPVSRRSSIEDDLSVAPVMHTIDYQSDDEEHY